MLFVSTYEDLPRRVAGLHDQETSSNDRLFALPRAFLVFLVGHHGQLFGVPVESYFSLVTTWCLVSLSPTDPLQCWQVHALSCFVRHRSLRRSRASEIEARGGRTKVPQLSALARFLDSLYLPRIKGIRPKGFVLIEVPFHVMSSTLL